MQANESNPRGVSGNNAIQKIEEILIGERRTAYVAGLNDGYLVAERVRVLMSMGNEEAANKELEALAAKRDRHA